jgi:hypothetical protein
MGATCSSKTLANFQQIHGVISQNGEFFILHNVTCRGDYRRCLDWLLDLFTTCRSSLQITIALSPFPHFTVHCYTHYCPLSVTASTIRFLTTDFNTGTIKLSPNYTFQISHKNVSLHSPTANWTVNQVKVRITLPLAVYRQSVRLGVKPLETHEQRCFSTEPLRS